MRRLHKDELKDYDMKTVFFSTVGYVTDGTAASVSHLIANVLPALTQRYAGKTVVTTQILIAQSTNKAVVPATISTIPLRGQLLPAETWRQAVDAANEHHLSEETSFLRVLLDAHAAALDQ